MSDPSMISRGGHLGAWCFTIPFRSPVLGTKEEGGSLRFCFDNCLKRTRSRVAVVGPQAKGIFSGENGQDSFCKE
jgi:hypothetical protein